MLFEDDKQLLSDAAGSQGHRRKVLWQRVGEARKKWLPIVHKWRTDLQADDWAIQPTYQHEPVEHSWKATKDGFIVMGLARPIPSPDGTVPKPDINIWGPDGLAIEVPDQYSMSELIIRTRMCSVCGARDVATVRVAFANRTCEECRPKLAAKLERPGWTN